MKTLYKYTTPDGDYYVFDYTSRLADSGGTIVSAAVATYPTPGDTSLTIGTPTVNVGAVVVDGVTIAIGKAVQVLITGGTKGGPLGAGVAYMLRCDIVSSVSGVNPSMFGRLDVPF